MLHELNSREGNGITVSLYWDSEDDATIVRIVDDRTETDETFHVPASAAADAFDHPFCYLEHASELSVFPEGLPALLGTRSHKAIETREEIGK
jgi:hypothetical protein